MWCVLKMDQSIRSILLTSRGEIEGWAMVSGARLSIAVLTAI